MWGLSQVGQGALALSTACHLFLFIQTTCISISKKTIGCLWTSSYKAHLVNKALVLERWMESRTVSHFTRLGVFMRDKSADKHLPTFIYLFIFCIFQGVCGWTKGCVFRPKMTAFLWVAESPNLKPKERWSPRRTGILSSWGCTPPCCALVLFPPKHHSRHQQQLPWLLKRRLCATQSHHRIFWERNLSRHNISLISTWSTVGRNLCCEWASLLLPVWYHFIRSSNSRD